MIYYRGKRGVVFSDTSVFYYFEIARLFMVCGWHIVLVLLGHSSSKSTEIYTHVAKTDMNFIKIH